MDLINTHCHHIIWKGKSTTVGSKNNLWAVLVGISKYEKTKPLNYADDDARDLMEFLIDPEKRLVDLGGAHIVPEEEANKGRILKELLWLDENAKDGDVVILYFAGHGLMFKGEYYFLTTGTDPTDRSELIKTSISGNDIRTVLSTTKGKKFIFADTCRNLWKGKKLSWSSECLCPPIES